MSEVSYALVTGASQGLGKAFARHLAAQKRNLILVARSGEKLKALAAQIRASDSVLAVPLEFDLAAPTAGVRLAQYLAEHKLSVDLLVNNAGFGLRGGFVELSLERQVEMLRLNNAAVVELTYALLPDLARHPKAGIINVASTAGFQPIPYASMYAATKSFLISFSLGLQQEIRFKGVSVVTLCPGRLLNETQMEQVRSGSQKFGFVYQSPEVVVQEALQSLEKGGGLVVPGFVNKISVFAQRLIPRRVVPRLVAKLSQQ